MQASRLSSLWPPHAGLPDEPYKRPVPLGSGNRDKTSPALRDKRIVIVEDEGITQLQLRKICQLAGMTIAGVATDGAQGVQRALEARPDLILMDVKMPLMDGFTAAELILKEMSVCIVMLTAYDLVDYKERAVELGTCGYIVKPVSATTLIPQLEAAYSSFRRLPQ